MKIKQSTLRRIIREEYSRLKRQGLIKESMSPSDPDYETVSEVIMQVMRQLMFGQISTSEVPMQCELLAGDYEVYHHLDYIIDQVMIKAQAMGL